ncbi:hypothetical protein FPZ54_13865 [Sphingomonas suaedae]|uniref:VCBS repeat-containing protein n=1 Tax=Sphingomonas suaedae TaxID=2599297 RepID=A0A518RHS2_9SPHN|nr:hypothetical protein [Sphingomonas suaedae]QDX26981.1 hypothetical protein FPZ54_13865 [Sphingomonas suaedae]
MSLFNSEDMALANGGWLDPRRSNYAHLGELAEEEMHRTRRLLKAAGWFLTTATAMITPGLAMAQQSTRSVTQTVTLHADIDGDGKPDLVTANLRPPARMFWINIELSTGRKFSPLSGYIDPARARMALTFRDEKQGGDIRCAEWRPSKSGVTCGAPRPSHGLVRAIVFETGQQIFLISYSEGIKWGGRVSDDHEHAYFQVMPAIEGPWRPAGGE